MCFSILLPRDTEMIFDLFVLNDIEQIEQHVLLRLSRQDALGGS